jgi:cytochrome b pre-mRNA-processing protein 3
MNLLNLFRRKPHERPGFMLYGAAVGAARDDWFYATLGVPDTLDGRFDTVGLHVSLLIRRLRTDPDPKGAAMAQAVFDAMFADMDVNLREMGVGDLSVGKKVKAMWEAFHGRAKAYEAAVEAGDAATLAQALQRNLWHAEAGDSGTTPAATALAAHALDLARHLAAQPMAALLRGSVTFPACPAGPPGATHAGGSPDAA